ncbi:MAG: dTDP-4-dehydrorhamnose 3,5-epimerase family protein [Deltaproteobacteria bacterium]|jgi:dTDP-4-dehydrorhamnose 3,5-epimerase|nr:dTDP-4-dehydrorhamnose 3,5-epimerase family protein [Deltaproteobacteria bacterium]
MRIISVTPLKIPDCKIIRFHRFKDVRGYFTEHFRQEEFDTLFRKTLKYPNARFVQANESRSVANVVRGLHFQWQPHVGKLVRTLYGHMVDMALDIRPGSPTLGKIILYDMPFDPEADHAEWLWIPPGFAHGNFYLADSAIEYFCTGEYNPQAEAGISPFAKDIDWSLADVGLRAALEGLALDGFILSDKDKDGHTLGSWLAKPESRLFSVGDLP